MFRAFICLLICVAILLGLADGQNRNNMIVEIQNHSVVFADFYLDGFYNGLCDKMTTRTEIQYKPDPGRPDFYNVTEVTSTRDNIRTDADMSCQYVCMKPKFNSENQIICNKQSYTTNSFHVTCENRGKNNNNNNDNTQCSCVDIIWTFSGTNYAGFNTPSPGACPDNTKLPLPSMATFSPPSSVSSIYSSTSDSVLDDESVTESHLYASLALSEVEVVTTRQDSAPAATTASFATAGDLTIDPLPALKQLDDSSTMSASKISFTSAGDAIIDPLLEQQRGDSPSSPSPTQESDIGKGDNTALALGVGLGCALLVVIIISSIAVIILWRKKQYLEGKVEEINGTPVLSRPSTRSKFTAHSSVDDDDVSTFTDFTDVEGTYADYIHTGSEYYEIAVDKNANRGRKAFSEVIRSSKGRKMDLISKATSTGENYNNFENKSASNIYGNMESTHVKGKNSTDMDAMQSATASPSNMCSEHNNDNTSLQDQVEDIYQNIDSLGHLAQEIETGNQNNVTNSGGVDYFVLEDVGNASMYNYDDEGETYELKEVSPDEQSKHGDIVVDSEETFNDNTYFILENEEAHEDINKAHEDSNIEGSHDYKDVYDNDYDDADNVTSDVVYEYDM